MTDFFRFPHTPHLAWLGTSQPREDKVLSPSEAENLLTHSVVVEEKVDGANVGLSVGPTGALLAQNRGSYIPLEAAPGQFKPLKRWLAPRAQELESVLRDNLILFGEWCYAVHSIYYTDLPDWFLAFDVYDKSKKEFWGVERRDELAARLELACVPCRGRGRYSLLDLTGLLSHSDLTNSAPEGIYIRQEENGRAVARAKLVRPEFVQMIGEHWARRALQVNSLASDRSVSSHRVGGRERRT
jgi:ATP-dependent RNA circularization protein (DNA/RNA ligase family)